MIINITGDNDWAVAQFFDAYYAYRQSLDTQTFTSDIELRFNQPYVEGYRILFSCMPTEPVANLDDYDLVLLANTGESLIVSTGELNKVFEHPRCVLMANAYLHPSHHLYHKIFWNCATVGFCRQFWSQHFYPQFFHNHHLQQTLQRDQHMCFINGANRTWRQFFLDLLIQEVPDLAVRNAITQKIQATDHPHWPSDEDEEFYRWCNYLYRHKAIVDADLSYYDNSVDIGVNNKFGAIAPGYFMLPEYYTHKCVVFPETTWQNNELCLTEKSLKCFAARCLPLPVGGANLNALYNELGFKTAWNLLPPELAAYDSMIDHRKRYQLLAKAVAWLNQNKSIFDDIDHILQQNFNQFYNANIDTTSCKRFDKLLGLA